jgi:hypothetical protein
MGTGFLESRPNTWLTWAWRGPGVTPEKPGVELQKHV